MRLAAYVRVSTAEQAEHGQGLDVQRRAVRAWARANGHSVALWCADEGQSGSNGLDTRTGLLEALSALSARQVAGLVVYRLDRLARDLVLQESLLADIRRAGGELFSTSAAESGYLADDPNDPSRALIRQVLGAVAQYERSMIRLRMAAGRAHKRARGGFIGGTPPLGWRCEGGELVADDYEQVIRARILGLHAEGVSLRGICQALESEGLPPKRGARWHPQSVKLVLDRGAVLSPQAH